jgi:hypothetical protein
MSVLFDRLVGVYRFLGDRIPKRISCVGPQPRRRNSWFRNGQPVVAKGNANGDIRLAIEQTIALMGNLSQAIGKGDRVLVKPNFNSPDTFPASTDLGVLQSVIELSWRLELK